MTAHVRPTVRIQAEDFDAGAEIARLTGGRTDIGAVVTFSGLCRDEAGSWRARARALSGHGRGRDRAHRRRGGRALAAQRAHRDPPLRPYRARREHRAGRCRLGPSPGRVRGGVLPDGLSKSRAPFWKKEHLADGADGELGRGQDADDNAAARWKSAIISAASRHGSSAIPGLPLGVGRNWSEVDAIERSVNSSIFGFIPLLIGIFAAPSTGTAPESAIAGKLVIPPSDPPADDAVATVELVELRRGETVLPALACETTGWRGGGPEIRDPLRSRANPSDRILRTSCACRRRCNRVVGNAVSSARRATVGRADHADAGAGDAGLKSTLPALQPFVNPVSAPCVNLENSQFRLF